MVKEEASLYYELIFQHMSEGLVAHDIIYDDEGVAIDYRILDVNPAFELIFGLKRDAIVGKTATEVYGVPAFLDIYANVAETLIPQQFDAPFGGRVYSVRAFAPRRGTFVTMFFDVTEERHRAQQQQVFLKEISTPLLPIAKGVVVMPLIGIVDQQRVHQVQETLLEGVVQHRATTVILDVTGVQVVDSLIANGLIQIARMVRLLGAQVMMTGIQPQIAQTLVHLGIELEGIATYGTLQNGIASVLKLS